MWWSFRVDSPGVYVTKSGVFMFYQGADETSTHMFGVVSNSNSEPRVENWQYSYKDDSEAWVTYSSAYVPYILDELCLDS